MTQPVQAAPTEVEDDDAPKMESIADLIQTIVAASGVHPDDIEDLPTGRRNVVPSLDKTSPAKVWVTSEGVPGREENFIIIGQFLDGDYVIAYAVPKRAVDKDGVVLEPSRFRVSQISGSCFTETLSLDSLISEMAEELAGLYEVAGDRLRVDCGVEMCGASNEANANFCSECGVKMPEDEEEAEISTSPVGIQSRGGPPPPPPS